MDSKIEGAGISPAPTTDKSLIIDKSKDNEYLQDLHLSDVIVSRRIDLRKEYPDIKFLLKLGNVGCCPAGEIVAFKGKAKNGKTKEEQIWQTAFLKGDCMGFKAVQKDLRLLHCDTEQSVLSTAKLVRQVHRSVGWSTHENHPNYMALNLRADSTESRPKIIEQAIKEYQPDVVFIDGIKDLLFDINNQTEATNLINFLLRLTKEYGCTLVCVLHENKADQNLRGSIGSELLNKCSECWQIKKDVDIFEVTQTECRNQPAEDWAFRLNEEGIPEPVEAAPKISKTELSLMKKADNFKCCMKPHVPIGYSELRRIYAETSGLKEKTAELHIAYAIKHNWIERQPSGEYIIHPLNIPM